MTNLTEKELTALEHQIGTEQTMVKKYEAMACLCPDEAIARELNDAAAKHRGHYNALLQVLQ